MTKSISLMQKYQEENNIIYDIVILTRFDVAILEKINYSNEKLSLNDTLYHNATTPIHKYKQPGPGICVCNGTCCDINSDKYEIGDLMFFSSSKNMYTFITEIENNIDEYLKYNSNHIHSYIQAKKLNLKLDCLLYTKVYNIYRGIDDGNITLTRWIV